MKIVNNAEKVGPSSAERVASAKPNANVADAKAPAAEASAQVALSDSAAGLQGGVPAAGDGDFDAQKVASISQAIAKGQFTVNADVIADKLISNAKDVLGKNSR